MIARAAVDEARRVQVECEMRRQECERLQVCKPRCFLPGLSCLRRFAFDHDSSGACALILTHTFQSEIRFLTQRLRETESSAQSDKTAQEYEAEVLTLHAQVCVREGQGLCSWVVGLGVGVGVFVGVGVGVGGYTTG